MGTQKEQRKHYIDNLRWVCILLLVPFHAAIAHNSWGEANYIHFEESKVLSAFVVLVSPWYMALMFVLAGTSARYSLQKRTAKEFLAERAKRLLFPLILGLLTVVPVMAYYADVFWNHYAGNFFGHYQIFFSRFTDLTGYDGGFTPGHLWFLLYLFFVSVLALAIICLQERFGKKNRFSPRKRLPNPGIGIVYACGLLPAVAKPVLNMNGKSAGAFFSLFMLGYYLLSQEEILAQIKKYRLPSLLVFLVSDTANVCLYLWSNLSGGLLNLATMQAALWFGILAALGYGQAYFNGSCKLTRWLSENSFLFYIWHFMWLVVCQFYMHRLLANTWVLFFASVIAAYLLTFGTILLVNRVRQRL